MYIGIKDLSKAFAKKDFLKIPLFPQAATGGESA
jgi:hypothetical protein